MPRVWPLWPASEPSGLLQREHAIRLSRAQVTANLQTRERYRRMAGDAGREVRTYRPRRAAQGAEPGSLRQQAGGADESDDLGRRGQFELSKGGYAVRPGW